MILLFHADDIGLSGVTGKAFCHFWRSNLVTLHVITAAMPFHFSDAAHFTMASRHTGIAGVFASALLDFAPVSAAYPYRRSRSIGA